MANLIRPFSTELIGYITTESGASDSDKELFRSIFHAAQAGDRAELDFTPFSVAHEETLRVISYVVKTNRFDLKGVDPEFFNRLRGNVYHFSGHRSEEASHDPLWGEHHLFDEDLRDQFDLAIFYEFLSPESKESFQKLVNLFMQIEHPEANWDANTRFNEVDRSSQRPVTIDIALRAASFIRSPYSDEIIECFTQYPKSVLCQFDRYLEELGIEGHSFLQRVETVVSEHSFSEIRENFEQTSIQVSLASLFLLMRPGGSRRAIFRNIVESRDEESNRKIRDDLRTFLTDQYLMCEGSYESRMQQLADNFMSIAQRFEEQYLAESVEAFEGGVVDHSLSELISLDRLFSVLNEESRELFLSITSRYDPLVVEEFQYLLSEIYANQIEESDEERLQTLADNFIEFATQFEDFLEERARIRSHIQQASTEEGIEISPFSSLSVRSINPDIDFLQEVKTEVLRFHNSTFSIGMMMGVHISSNPGGLFAPYHDEMHPMNDVGVIIRMNSARTTTAAAAEEEGYNRIIAERGIELYHLGRELSDIHLGDDPRKVAKALVVMCSMSEDAVYPESMIDEIIAPTTEEMIRNIHEKIMPASEWFKGLFRVVNHAVRSEKNIFFHCSEGRSRSAIAMMAYFMRMFEVSYEEAFTYLHAHRQVVDPAPGFVALLKFWDAHRKE